MNTAIPSLLIDASVAVTWHIPGEPHAVQARELLLDWQSGAIEIGTIDQMPAEVANALLNAGRRNRLERAVALVAVQNLLVLRMPRFRVTNTIVLRAWEIAATYNQRIYDCVYVAVAERKRLEFWTGDRRLFNALGSAFPFVRWLANYQRKRLSP
jgi:predicted nucleic acid-binding protein